MARKTIRQAEAQFRQLDSRPPRPPKLFVLDTNVILHDSRCIFNFQDNDIYIPVSVIEELDKFKKGDDNLGFNARAFVRALDKISDNTLFDRGIRTKYRTTPSSTGASASARTAATSR